MLIPSWLSSIVRPVPARHQQRPTFRPCVETLEGRDLMTATLAISDVTVYETNFAGVNARFTVTLSEPSTSAVSVSFATANGTAKSKSDYIAASGALVFAPGEISKTIDIAIVVDGRIE